MSALAPGSCETEFLQVLAIWETAFYFLDPVKEAMTGALKARRP